MLLPPGQVPVVLQLAAQAEITAVEVDRTPAVFTFRDNSLTIPHPAATEEKPTRLTIRYGARFADPLPTETVGIEDPSFGVGAAIGPEGTYLSAGTPWFPQLPGQRARHRVVVTAPAGIVAVTAGRFTESTTRDGRTVTVWENDFPLEGLALAAGRYEIGRDDLDGIQLLTFLSTENASLAPGYLAAMRRHLAFYRDLLGPYPFTKFAVVENFLPTGYGMPSWTLLGKSVVRLPFLLDTSLPHEIVHSWWGNAVEVDYREGNWSEGLTTYLADYLLKERDNPAEALEYRRKLLRDYAALVDAGNDFPLRSFGGRMARYQQAVGYGKGAMVFHMLRREVGDEMFRKALRRMAAEGSGRALGWTDIERIFTGTSRRELRWFFAQWVERKGAPVLALADVRAVRTDGGWTVSGVITRQGDSFRLDLPLQLMTEAADEPIEQTISLNGERTPFRLTTRSRPVTLRADPDSDIFRRLEPGELPATINDLFTPRNPLVVVAAGQDGLVAASRDLLRGLHWDYAEVVSEVGVNREMLKDRDLLYLGWPKNPELQPKRPATAGFSGTGPSTWQPPGSEQQADVLFTVLAGRHQDGARVAVLTARSADAARAVAAKVSHYGRYSQLWFAAGRNIGKITREPDRSPLRFDFSQDNPS